MSNTTNQVKEPKNLGVIISGYTDAGKPCMVLDVYGVGKILIEDKTPENSDEKVMTHHRYTFENVGAQKWFEDNFGKDD